MKPGARDSLKTLGVFVLLCLAGAAVGWLVIPAPSSRPAGDKGPFGAASGTGSGGQIEFASDGTFGGLVLASTAPVLVDFYADWCAPCQELEPVLEELARETPMAKIVKVNVDQEPSLAARYGVDAIPKLVVIQNGQVVAEHTGSASKAQLKAMLAPYFVPGTR